MKTIDLSQLNIPQKYESVSRNVIETLMDYLGQGIPTGGFLRSVLENDLMMASAKADSYNRLSLPDIALYIYYYFPQSSYGSKEEVDRWLESFEEEQGDKDDGDS